VSGANGGASAVDALLWPADRAGEALATLAAAMGSGPRGGELGAPPPAATPAELATWLDEAGQWLGVEVEPTAVAYDGLGAALRDAAPALVTMPAGGTTRLLVVVRARRGALVVLDPDLRATRVAIADVATHLAGDLAPAAARELAPTLDRAGLAGTARARAEAALVAARLRGRHVGGIHLVRRPPEASPRALARDLGLGSRLAWLVVLHLLAQALWIGSWWAIGRSVLGAMVSPAWIGAWALMFVSFIALRAFVAWLAGRLAIDAGAALSQRLMAGALRIDPDRLRRDGIGVALGRVLEADALQANAVSGGLLAMLATVEIVLAGGVLAVGAGGAIHVVLLVAVVAHAIYAARRYLAHRRTWTAHRLELTHSLAEAMVGQSTRLAQGDAAALADRDDHAVVRYLGAARDMDRASWRLATLPRVLWPLVAALGLAPVIVTGSATTAALATAIAGMLFAAQALGRLADGATRIADAAIAWDSVDALFSAATDRPDAAPPALALAPPSPRAPALTTRGLGFQHARRGAPVLAGCDLVIAHGDRALLEGASGTGKSTFAAIISGLRRPDTGLVLASGLDRASVGASGWRRRVACAPQFHDNYVFGGPLAFNLLVGRAWPPSPEDLVAADAVCRELGLGDLVDRMPGGMYQQVGETGWQLSHGEKSRVFLARALLQKAGVVVLDESLAALDPENLAVAIRCIEARAETAIVIAHP
jgi:ATP-binding cassette, subfamily B, bacterial